MERSCDGVDIRAQRPGKSTAQVLTPTVPEELGTDTHDVFLDGSDPVVHPPDRGAHGAPGPMWVRDKKDSHTSSTVSVGYPGSGRPAVCPLHSWGLRGAEGAQQHAWLHPTLLTSPFLSLDTSGSQVARVLGSHGSSHGTVPWVGFHTQVSMPRGPCLSAHHVCMWVWTHANTHAHVSTQTRGPGRPTRDFHSGKPGVGSAKQMTENPSHPTTVGQ